MMHHIQSFLVGSLASGTIGLLIHQQLSHRNRLTHKWPLAEKAEDELRNQLKNLRKQLNNNEKLVGVNNDAYIDKAAIERYYKKMMDDAQNFFKKED